MRVITRPFIDSGVLTTGFCRRPVQIYLLFLFLGQLARYGFAVVMAMLDHQITTHNREKKLLIQIRTTQMHTGSHSYVHFRNYRHMP